jgi:serine/threonine protein kinase
MSKDAYDVLERIGQGSFGIVRKVRRKVDKVTLCWKEINFGKMSEKEKSQLVSEVNIIRELRNPFIVRYHDRILDKPSTSLYIVMEYCPNGDLAGLIKKARRDRTYVDEYFVWKILAQSVLALKECHRRIENGQKKPILHRDLKPANILLDVERNVKIADFGLAKELSSKSQLAQTNLGTPYYMAPEIINEKDYDEKADIWSLGCLVYELAALKPPFDAGNAVSLAVKINKGQYQRLPSKYSNDLMTAISKMIQLDPRRRPRVEDLENAKGIEGAMRSAKGLLTSHLANVSMRYKEREIQKREEKVSAKERELSSWEAQLKERERKVVQGEQELKRRVDKFEREARAQRRQSFGTMNNGGMEIDADEADESPDVPAHLRNLGEAQTSKQPPQQQARGLTFMSKPRYTQPGKPAVPTVSIYIDDEVSSGATTTTATSKVRDTADGADNGTQRARTMLGRGSLATKQQTGHVDPPSVFLRIEDKKKREAVGFGDEQHRYMPATATSAQGNAGLGKENIPPGVQRNVIDRKPANVLQNLPVDTNKGMYQANVMPQKQQDAANSSPWKKRRQQPPPPPRPLHHMMNKEN